MWLSSSLELLSISNPPPDSTRNRLRQAFKRNREQSLLMTAGLKFGAVTLLLVFGLSLGHAAGRQEWRDTLHILWSYWGLTFACCLLIWGGFQPVQLFGFFSALIDILMIYWLQSHWLPQAVNSGGAAGYPMAIFCALIILAAFHLPRVATLLMSILAAACEISLLQQAGIRSGAHVIAAVILVVTGLTASFLVRRLNHLIGVVLREELRRSRLGRYFSPSVASKLAEDGVRAPAPEEHHVTVLFAELTGFDDLAPSLAPAEVIAVLNDYYDLLVKIVFKYHGTLDKFLGCGLMAYFGAPIVDHRHADLAVRCGMEIVAAVERGRRQRWESGLPVLQVVVGIHSGPVILGNIGAEGRRLEYTAIGDTVNLAARIKSLATEQRVDILVSDATRELADKRFYWRGLEPLRVRGKAQPVVTYKPQLKVINHER
jgi:adenylate cyclase